MNRLIQQGFVSCFQQFGGNYILYQKLIRRNDLYGHSFFAEFANILPSKRQTAVHAQVPSWKGPFKTKTGKSLGNFALYPSIRGANYQSSALTFIKEIRTADVIHASQFSVSWLLNKSAKDDYKFTYQQGESSSAFNIILDELYDKQSILIADLVPIVGCEHMARKVCIEPFSRCSASLRFLNVDNLPPILHLKNVLVDQDYPIGSCLATTKVGIEMPKAPLQPEHRTLSLFTILPNFITKLKESHKLYSNDTQMDDQSVGTPEIRVEDVADPVIQLPLTVDLFGQELKKTYLETLYTPETFIDATVVHIGKCIDYLLQNNHSRQDIVASIFDYTMPLADLDMKHHNEIPNARNAPNSSNCTLEQTYQYAWWKEIKSKAHASPDFERKSCVALKLREAQLQTINYCFICKLTNDPRQLEVYSRDPFEEARNFFSKVVVIFSMNDDISDFMASLDFEQGAQATKKRDPCTLNDHAFAQVLAKRFNELSDLVEHFKESAGADDMASLPSLDLADDVLDDNEEFQQQEELQPQPQPFAPLTPSTPSASSSSKPPRIESRTLSNTRIVKPNHPPKKSAVKSTPSVNLEPKLAKTFMPQKMARSTSNTLDSFYKRMVNVTSSASTSSEPQRGEATKESIAKMKRAAVDGKATMKRAGSFTKSALSPRRPKRTVSMLSQAPQETGTVILRRDNSIPNPETTPRTSLNRYLGTNLFADYSEACPSPTSRTSPTSAATSSAYVQSEYPQAPKTPQGTSSRFRKIMMDRTPHRHDDQSDLEEFSQPDESETVLIDQRRGEGKKQPCGQA
ncbi:hypothetical protein G6F42_017249 [Rhizopus arrhizus]|nr:hypothetical protein G6F42_017249 [Rhizopus arrhizus]